MTPSRNCPVWIFLGLVLAASGCSCGEPCDPATDVPRCEGNVVLSCPEPGVDQLVGANRWRSNDCEEVSKVCVEAPGEVFCALSSVPNELCADASSACESATSELRCTEGFATYRFECQACEAAADGGTGTVCRGGPSWKCAADDECASGNCSDLGYCGARDAGG